MSLNDLYLLRKNSDAIVFLMPLCDVHKIVLLRFFYSNKIILNIIFKKVLVSCRYKLPMLRPRSKMQNCRNVFQYFHKIVQSSTWFSFNLAIVKMVDFLAIQATNLSDSPPCNILLFHYDPDIGVLNAAL